MCTMACKLLPIASQPIVKFCANNGMCPWSCFASKLHTQVVKAQKTLQDKRVTLHLLKHSNPTGAGQSNTSP
jgi:hypothetical protein